MNAKQYLTNILRSGHRHTEISQALLCYECGHKMKKWERERNRLQERFPEEFVRKESDYKPGEKTANLADKLFERIRTDKEYQEHLRKLSFGTEEEKKREVAKSNSGYFKRPR